MKCIQRDEFLAEKDKSCKRRRDDQDPPPPLPDLDLSKRRRHDAGASSSLQPQAPQSSAWKKSDTRDAPSSSFKQQSGPHAEQPPIPDVERPATPKPAWVIPTSHIPDAVNNWANALATTYQAPTENSLLEKTGDMRTFMNWYCQKMGKTELTQADLEGQAYEVIDWANREGDQVRIDINKPLPLSGPPCHVIIQTQFFFNKDLDYLRYGSKGSGQALSISKMKAAHYHDFGLELLIPEHMWIDDGVRIHMRILSVVRIKAYSRYKYDYLKEITLHIADHQEYTIAEKDFKNLYTGDFEDLNLLLLQGHLNHLPGLDIRFEFKHDYTIIDSSRAVVFLVNNNEQKIMRFNEIYKFSDGTLTSIMEALDYRVKEYKVNRLNPDSRPEGSSGIWNALLVDEFAILTTDFFREWNDLFILSIRSKSENKGIVPTEMELVLEQTQQGTSHEVSVQVKMEMEMEVPHSSGVNFITAYSTDTSKELMKA
ncbi:hypothetical protein Tco_0264673 [Tanacetum coccineum]